MNAPPRILDSPSGSSSLRLDLSRAAEHSSGSYDVQAGLATLRLHLSAGAANSYPSETNSPGSLINQDLKRGGLSPTVAKMGWLGSGLSVLGVMFYLGANNVFISRPNDLQKSKVKLDVPENGRVGPGALTLDSSAPLPKTSPERVEGAASSDEVQSINPLVPALKPGPTVNQGQKRHLHRLPAESKKKGPFSSNASSVEHDEMLLLETVQVVKIRSLLAAKPNAAYELAQKGHRDFPSGMMRQEREGLLILALHKTNRVVDAEVRTRLFLSRYPRSPLRNKLQRLLKDSGP